jgi:hypothetical protein
MGHALSQKSLLQDVPSPLSSRMNYYPRLCQEAIGISVLPQPFRVSVEQPDGLVDYDGRRLEITQFLQFGLTLDYLFRKGCRFNRPIVHI